MDSLVTFNFLKLAIDTVFDGTKAVLSSSPTGGARLKFENSEKLNSNIQYDQTNGTCTWKTTGDAVYSEEPESSAVTVNCINIGSYDGNTFDSYYTLPFGQNVSVGSGSQIKVNPYKENSEGEHIRGIKVVFKLKNSD